MSLKFQSTRELLGQRAIALRARRRGRDCDATSTLIARIDAELERRRTGRLDQAAATVPQDLSADDARDGGAHIQGTLFAEDQGDESVRAAWRRLVEERLPAMARVRGWSIREDHCFARILLDVAVERPWREIIPPPAWRNTPIANLRRAVEIGEALLEDREAIDTLNNRSLELRRKRRSNVDPGSL